MASYIAKRIGLAIPTLFLASVIIFVAMRVIPGDVAGTILGPNATPESIARVRSELGLDRPLLVQYVDWIWGLVRLDLGNSMLYQRTAVGALIKDALPITITLAAYGMVLTIVFAFPLGVYSARKQGSFTDNAIRAITVGGLSIPTFWLGVLVLFVFITVFTWTPSFQYVSIFTNPWENFTNFISPGAVMAFHSMAVIARMLRSQMLEVMGEDYIRTAHAKGLPPRIIAWRHAVPNALLPVVTVTGSQFAILISGLVVVERIFNLPGLGTLMINGARNQDYLLVQSLFLMIAAMVLAINLVVDILYSWLDPRVKLGRE